VTLKRLTFDYILLQGILRLFAIRETIRDAVAAVKTDRELAERLGKRAIRPLIRALEDDNVEVRARAAEALGTLADPRVVEPLIEALAGPSELVRERAAKALGAVGDARAVEPLIKALQDRDRYVKAAAAGALKRLDPSAAARAGVR
jgi:HEAT repeat protein